MKAKFIMKNDTICYQDENGVMHVNGYAKFLEIWNKPDNVERKERVSNQIKFNKAHDRLVKRMKVAVAKGFHPFTQEAYERELQKLRKKYKTEGDET